MKKQPDYLRPGDTIGIVATARKVSPEEMAPAIKRMEQWGLKVILGKNLYHTENQFSGSDAERAADLQEMLDDPEVKAVIIARGGYGTVRVVDRLNWDIFSRQPKWIIGYSDVTVLHSHIHTHLGIETLHATMPINFEKNAAATASLKSALFGEQLSYQVSGHLLNREGDCSAKVIGGNLSLLYSLAGTPSDIDTRGKILLIEDLDEYVYHIDRMMIQLKRSGKLKGLKGLVAGGMNDMRDNAVPFGKTAEEIINEAVAEYDYPVCFGFPSGHIAENFALILGREAELKVNEKGVSLVFSKRA